MDAKTDERTEAYCIDEWEAPQEIMIDGIKGWTRCGVITVPDSLTMPSAITIKKIDTDPKDGHSLDYISEVELTRYATGCRLVQITVCSQSVHMSVVLLACC